MNESTPLDGVSAGFACRQWEPSRESWDDYLRVLEHAYAQYLDRSRRTSVTGEAPPAPNPDDLRD